MEIDRGWKGIAREISARALHYSGAPYLVRRTRARGFATVLLYHDPAPEVMERHLAYLAGRFVFTTLDRVVEAIAGRDWSGIPERALVLTIDDGLRGNHALLPAFRRFGIRPTIYLCSQVVGTQRRFWFQEPGPIASLKELPNRERLDALKRSSGFEPERSYPEPRQALSRDEILEMAPWVDFGSHTRFHPILPRCDDGEAWDEIASSKRELEDLLGRPVRHFSYPNGDFGAREIAYVRRAGYASARTTDLGWASLESDPFRLATIGVSDDGSVHMLAAQLGAIANRLRRVLQRAPRVTTVGDPAPSPGAAAGR
jgi:peptidoglycan/xylan/chitin deacetylase (PgdA/CDA1 family)